MNIKKLVTAGAKFIKSHDRSILTGLSIAGTVSAVIFAWKARPKCEKVLKELEAEGADNLEKAKRLAPILAPTAIATGVSVVCDIAAFKVADDMIGVLTNAYTATCTANEMRKVAEKEIVGEDKAEEIEKTVAKKTVESIPDEEIETTGHGDVIFIEPNTGKVLKSSKDYIELGLSRCDTKLARCYDSLGICVNDEYAISFNDIFNEWGIRRCKFGDMFEFKARDNRKLTWNFIPFEYEHDNGEVELGYIIDIVSKYRIIPNDDMIEREEN